MDQPNKGLNRATYLQIWYNSPYVLYRSGIDHTAIKGETRIQSAIHVAAFAYGTRLRFWF